MNEIYELTFSNGLKLPNIRMNGNNYISNTEVTKEMLSDGLSTVTIKGSDNNETVMKDVEIIQIARYTDGWYFILREIPEEEKKSINIETELTNLQLALAEVYEMILA